MLARRFFPSAPFGRRDATRLVVYSALLIAVLTAILSIDIFPSGTRLEVGQIAPTDVLAPRTAEFTSQLETQQARDAARQAVPFQYTYTEEGGAMVAARQVAAFERSLADIDAAFATPMSDAERAEALAEAAPNLSAANLATLQSLTPARWIELRTEMEAELAAAQREEVRDAVLTTERSALRDRLDIEMTPDERDLCAALMTRFLVANSTYDAVGTERARDEAANAVAPVRYTISQGELLVAGGTRVTAEDAEKLAFFGLLDPAPDGIRALGWLAFAALTVALALAWVWRFRPKFWHRNNALLLLSFLLVAATAILKLTGDRSVLPFFAPIAAAGLLTAVLLDAGAALMLAALLASMAAAITGEVELPVFVFAGSLAGIVAIRRGERIGHFLQAAVAMAIVNVTVVAIFALLGERDLAWALQLTVASFAAAGGAAVAAIGSFVLLGNVFGITTSFQLLELANPSQPLLRRLLLETSGTYHHSLMVGNLAERAAEAIGADPLLARVGAYYHDIGKLANPLAFIENQGGTENIHDELTPEQSVALLKAHVANGIDLAYQYRLPTAVIAFIPQHHGTALISYFYARAKEEAVRAAGATPGTPQAAKAEASVDPARFRHSGPKPQTKEAAILMLADGVEASVRSLTSHDEPAIRAMVARIIRERLDDGQFHECDLTLRDLELIREAFVSQLLGMYHRRIEYPQNKIVELESRRAAGGGGTGAR